MNNRSLYYVMICSFLLISLVGICIAAQSPSNIIYFQGGASTITNGTDGIRDIMVNDIVPYAYLTEGNRSRMISIEQLSIITYPLNGAMVFSGADNESVSMVTIHNLTLSEGNKVITLQVTPMKYYDGEALKDFADIATPFDENNIEKAQSFSIYTEVKQKVLENY